MYSYLQFYPSSCVYDASLCSGALSCGRSHWRLYSKVSDGAPDDFSSIPLLIPYPRFLATNHLEWYPKVNCPLPSHVVGLMDLCRPQVGSGVRSVRPGDRVAMEPGAFCRKCEACRTGRYQVGDANISPFPRTYSRTVQLALFRHGVRGHTSPRWHIDPILPSARRPSIHTSRPSFSGRWRYGAIYLALLRLVLRLSSPDRTPFGWCSLCLHASQITAGSINCGLWLWSCWASLYGRGESHRSIEDYRRRHSAESPGLRKDIRSYRRVPAATTPGR